MGRNKVLEYPKPFIQWPPNSEELADATVDLLDSLSRLILRYNGNTSTCADQIVNSIGQKILYN